MTTVKNKAHIFDIRSDEAFVSLSHSFAHVLHAVKPLGSIPVPYHGKNLYHHFQIGVNGAPGSGKSTFVASAVNNFFAPLEVNYKKLSVPSADQTRKVLVWGQWIARSHPFEVRTGDTLAQSALEGLAADVILQESDLPGISFFEHAPEELLEFCPMLLRFEYNKQHERRLVVHPTENVALPSGYKKFLDEGHIFRIG